MIRHELNAAYRKRYQNHIRIAALKQLLKECNDEQMVVSNEISEWLKTCPISSEFKSELKQYFLSAGQCISDNFHRDVKKIFEHPLN